MGTAHWFTLRYGTLSRTLFRLVASGPDRSGVAVTDTDLAITMGASFSGRAPRSDIVSARALAERVSVTRGAHGWQGDWLVNGAADGLVEIRFEPPLRAHVAGFPVRVRRLRVAVDDPVGLVAALETGGDRSAWTGEAGTR